jgi:ATP-dependent DNA helicase RecQ
MSIPSYVIKGGRRVTEEDVISRTAKKHFGIEALFPRQRLVISNILQASGYYGAEEAAEAPDRQLIIFPTGMGKSVCFMLPALLIEAITVVIFPLLSLMNDQKRRFDEAGIPSVLIRGGQEKEERREIYRQIRSGDIRAVLLNPEVFRMPEVIGRLSECGAIHLVIDEAHTIPEWGETFRPSCLEIAAVSKKLPVRQITAFTATAGERIIAKITELIFDGLPPRLVSALPDRPNIHYRAVPAFSRSLETAHLLASVLPRPAVVFCRSRIETEITAADLRTLLRGCIHPEEIRFFHAGLEREEKDRIAEWFFSSRSGVLTATTAYGLGVDKPDIRTVIHHRPAPSVEAFLQESGRGGRDRKPAWSAVILTTEDLSAGGGRRGDDPRARALLGCFTDPCSCRRKALLSLLDAEIEECGGCDVCDDTVMLRPRGWEETMLLFSLMPMRLTAKEASKLLAGLLPDWSPGEAEGTLAEMLASGLLLRSKRGPWRGLIRPAGFPFSIPRSFFPRSSATSRNPPRQYR